MSARADRRTGGFSSSARAREAFGGLGDGAGCLRAGFRSRAGAEDHDGTDTAGRRTRVDSTPGGRRTRPDRSTPACSTDAGSTDAAGGGR
jgi:hypothetical protein